MLWHFVVESTVSQAADATGLSRNSIAAIYSKLRKYFVDCGLFHLPSVLRDEFTRLDPEWAHLMEYHRMRIAEKRGVRKTNEFDYHLAETCWREEYKAVMMERPSKGVYEMMNRNLLQVIRLCGPVGKANPNKASGLLAYLYHSRELSLWLQRNVPEYEGIYDQQIEDERRFLDQIYAQNPEHARYLARFLGYSVFEEEEDRRNAARAKTQSAGHKNLRFR